VSHTIIIYLYFQLKTMSFNKTK